MPPSGANQTCRAGETGGGWRTQSARRGRERDGEQSHMHMHTNKPASPLCMQPCGLGHVASSPWQSLQKRAGACVCVCARALKKQKKKITIQVSVSAEQHEPKTSDLIAFLIPPVLPPPQCSVQHCCDKADTGYRCSYKRRCHINHRIPPPP